MKPVWPYPPARPTPRRPARMMAWPWLVGAALVFGFPAGAADTTPASAVSDGATQEKATPETLLRAIAQRQEELANREAELERDADRLRTLKREIEGLVERAASLQAERERHSEQEATEARDRENARFASLAKTYEAMEPEDAAARIERMNERLALKLLSRIKPKAAAQILSGINAAKAARLSERLARGQY